MACVRVRSYSRRDYTVAPKRAVQLKPDDPVWADLISDIEAVVSGRYAEDLDFVSGMPYAPSVEEPGFEFSVLTRKDRQNLLADMVDWRGYGTRGMSHDQQSIIIGNVLDGKPQERWLDGVFDEGVLQNGRIINFNMSVESMKNGPTGHHFVEVNGDCARGMICRPRRSSNTSLWMQPVTMCRLRRLPRW